MLVGADIETLKLKYGYHDARIRAIQYRDGSDIVIDVDLCGCCNQSPVRTSLCFHGARNFATVQEAIEATRLSNADTGYIDEIIGIVRDDERGYLLDLATSGAIRIDAKGLHES